MLPTALILERLYRVPARTHRRRLLTSVPAAERARTNAAEDAVAGTAEQGIYASFMSSKTLWFASFVALGTADFGSVAQLTPTSFLVLEGMGAAGGAGLLASSASDLKKSKSTEEKLDSANNIAWGGQGLMYLVPDSLGALQLGLGLGLVGSAMQTAVGLMRLRHGLVGQDQSQVKLGLLDVGGGLLWLAWDLVGARQPIFIGAYIAVKAGREAYANRKAFVRFLRSLKTGALDSCRRATRTLESTWQEFEAGFNEGWNERGSPA